MDEFLNTYPPVKHGNTQGKGYKENMVYNNIEEGNGVQNIIEDIQYIRLKHTECNDPPYDITVGSYDIVT